MAESNSGPGNKKTHSRGLPSGIIPHSTSDQLITSAKLLLMRVNMSRPTKPKVRDGVKISFYIPKEWHDELKKLSEENRVTISDLCRLAIREFLDKRK